MFAAFSAAGSLVQTPFGPRKSGIPDSVEMPAPVSTTTCLASRSQPAISVGIGPAGHIGSRARPFCSFYGLEEKDESLRHFLLAGGFDPDYIPMSDRPVPAVALSPRARAPPPLAPRVTRLPLLAYAAST